MMMMMCTVCVINFLFVACLLSTCSCLYVTIAVLYDDDDDDDDDNVYSVCIFNVLFACQFSTYRLPACYKLLLFYMMMMCNVRVFNVLFACLLSTCGLPACLPACLLSLMFYMMTMMMMCTVCAFNLLFHMMMMMMMMMIHTCYNLCCGTSCLIL